MKVLMLGGTRFLGRNMVQAALDRDAEVTLFHRSPGSVFPELEHIYGDRRGELKELSGRSWDVVIDTSGYVPSEMRRATRALADHVDHYLFISSVSVYAEVAADTSEESPLAKLSESQLVSADKFDRAEEPRTAAGFAELYGALKALCEAELESAMPGRALILRPGFIVGPHDFSPRMPYWIDRTHRGGRILAPGPAERPVRVIDGQDLANFALRLCATRQRGILNATGADGLTMKAILDACVATADRPCELVWFDDAQLLAEGVRPFVDLPYWLPPPESELLNVRNDAAQASGLTFSSIESITRRIADWRNSMPEEERRVDSAFAAREAELVNAASAGNVG